MNKDFDIDTNTDHSVPSGFTMIPTNDSPSISNAILVKVINKSILDLPSYSTEHSDAVDLKAAFDCFDYDDEGVYPRIMGNDMYRITRKYITEDIALMPFGNIEIVLYPGGRILIPTGLYVELPEGWRLHVYGRSGLGLHNGITISNGVGKIDGDYRGQIGAIITNHGEKNFVIKFGDRIAQMSIEPSYRIGWDKVDKLNDTTRGQGGFGHTGNK